jgi:two-component system sensor histidine kinase KdpD
VLGAIASLAIVVAASAWRGLWPGVAVALGASALQIYFLFLTPRSFPIPIAALICVSFVAAAAAVGLVSDRAATHAREAAAWREQMRDLYEFSRRALEINLHIEPGQQLVELIQETFAIEAVVLFDADLHETYQAGYWSQDPTELAQIVCYFETSDDDPKTGVSRRVLRLGSVPVGSLVLRGETSPLTNNAIAAMIATTFDRYRAFANESQLETERHTEQLRSTVLDSLAHAYKTPLTAIRAASTGLTEMGKLSAAQADLVSLIDEQAAVLNELTTRLLTTSQLEAGEVSLRTERIQARTLIDQAVAGLKDRLASMKTSIEVDDDLEVTCDRELMQTLLTQYIDNACKYSHYGTTISIGASRARAETIFSVHSFGSEIPLEDRERIFDRYYRSRSASRRASGTGIGLAVAKRAAQMHGGHVWVMSDEARGTTFFAAIPTQAPQRSKP